MAALSPVRPGVWRWDGTDADHGFPIVGYAIALPDGLVLVDPPGTSGSAEELRGLGQPVAIVLTSPWHVRGAAKWAETFGIPILGPASARAEVEEAGGRLHQALGEDESYSGWQVLHLTSGQGDTRYDELAFWHPATATLVVGDLLVSDQQGQPALGPVLYGGLPPAALAPVVERLAALSPRWILSAHLGPREDAQQLLAQVRPSHV